MPSSFEEERVLKQKSFPFIGILTVLSLSALVLFYILSAPTLKERNRVSKLLFNAKSAIRRRPTLNSVPFAQAHEGTKLEVTQVESDWVQVRVRANVVGWVQGENVTVVTPSPLKPSYRQIARRNIILFVNKIRINFLSFSESVVSL